MNTLKGLLLILSLLPYNSYAQVCGKVTHVIDGDSFIMTLQDSTTVQVDLYGIDCPEKGRPFGTEARSFTNVMLFKQNVCVEERAKGPDGTLIGVVHYNGSILNDDLLSSGMAIQIPGTLQTPKADQLFIGAQQHKLGMWAGK